MNELGLRSVPNSAKLLNLRGAEGIFMQICSDGKHHTTTSTKIFLLLATTLTHPDLETFLQGRIRQQIASPGGIRRVGGRVE
jgi:hypothetical protein